MRVTTSILLVVALDLTWMVPCTDGLREEGKEG